MKVSIKNILWIYAFLLIGIVYLFGLFIDITGDSGLYAAITRQMVESGDWFNLKINGEPYDQKPHLFFWLAGVGIKLFGNTNFGFKIFPFIYGLLGIYFTYRLGKDLFSNETRKLAALFLATSQIFILYSLDIHTDTILQTGVTLALWQLLIYLKYKKRINFIFGFVGVGLAMFSKGPIGAIIPFFAILFFLLVKKDYRQLIHYKWIIGVAIAFLIISPTLIHLYQSFGLEGLKFFFITNNVGRITGNYAGSSSDPFYYIATFLWAFLPWTVFVLAGLYSEMKSWIKKSDLNIWSFSLLGSVLILLLILSVAKGKAPNYFLIAVAPISVVVSNWLSKFSQLSAKTQRIIIHSQRIFNVIFCVIIIVFIILFSRNNTWLSIIILVLLIVTIILSVKYQHNKLRRIILISLLATGSVNLFLNIEIIPTLFKLQGARQALEIYEKNRDKNDILINLHLEEYELFYYANSNVKQFSDWDEYYKLFRKAGTWIYTSQDGYDGIVDLKHKLDTVYMIKQRGMNEITMPFLMAKTREESLNNNYLIKVR